MPLLTRAEFRRLLPGLADVLAPDDPTFEAAERDAGDVASRLSGYGVPEDAADAPAALRRPVAHLVAYALAGTVQLTPERMTWLRDAARQAREDLQAEGTVRSRWPDAPAASAARVGCIDAIPAW